MDGKVLSPGAYFVNDRTLPGQPFAERAPHYQLGTGASLIVTVLLSWGFGQRSGGLSPHCSRLLCDSLSVKAFGLVPRGLCRRFLSLSPLL
jgi:hypothetical protein